ncbi:MAG: glycosyltransferase family A protein, partial [Nitrosopumilaceae archaeon]
MFRLDKETENIPDSNESGKVAVIMPARNEQDHISNSLKSLVAQKLKPYRIIVINDGSSDKTGEIASGFENVEVIDMKPHENYVAKKELALTLKAGFDKLQDDTQCQYVLITGGDIIYPENYLSTITTRMRSNPKIAVSSG